MQTLEEQQKSGEASEPAKKKPVLFSKEHLGKSPHARWLNSTIRSNRRGKNNNLLMTYQKANGEVVERRIKPLSANKHLLLAHDYNRNNVRSFHIDRIQKMEKSAFELGFEKRAFEKTAGADLYLKATRHDGKVDYVNADKPGAHHAVFTMKGGDKHYRKPISHETLKEYSALFKNTPVSKENEPHKALLDKFHQRMNQMAGDKKTYKHFELRVE